MQHDLIIVGGGLVGAGLAKALASSKLDIALIDAGPPFKGAADPRHFALNHGSCQFLKNLKLWPKLENAASPIHQVHVSYRGHFGTVVLRHEEVRLPELGHVIPAALIEKSLHEALSTSKLTLYRPATLKQLIQKEQATTLTIETERGEKILHAPIIIAADGADSTVRSQLHIATDILDYGQYALVTKTHLQRSHFNIAYERFTHDGAIAMLPMRDGLCATIWSGDQKTITHLMSLADDIFISTLQKTFGYRLGRLLKIDKRYIFPLRMVRAKKTLEQGVLLIGNAAHTLHPIAAQGFNLALYEVAVLVEGLMETLAKKDLFTHHDLIPIHSKLFAQQNSSIHLAHQLSTLFSSPSLWMNLALPIGMMGLDRITAIKTQFIKRIMGKTQCQPRLLLKTSDFLSANGL